MAGVDSALQELPPAGKLIVGIVIHLLGDVLLVIGLISLHPGGFLLFALPGLAMSIVGIGAAAAGQRARVQHRLMLKELTVLRDHGEEIVAEAARLKQEGKNPIRYLESKGLTLLRTRTMVMREVKAWLQTELDLTGQVVIVGQLVERLKRLPNLKRLVLRNAPVTDAQLDPMRGLTKLEDLDLGNTKVTDAGLEYLKGLPNLKSVVLANTQVTDAGVQRLQEALPDCYITR